MVVFKEAVYMLVEIGAFCYDRGWVPATSGNFSVRLNNEQLAITASGVNKGRLDVNQVLIANLDGKVIGSDLKASAETQLHCQLYRRFQDVWVVLHVHSPAATVLSRQHDNFIQFSNYEILKAFPGNNTHEGKVVLPIFQNDQNIDRLAQKVDEVLADQQDIFGYLIQGHGLYTWGADMETAKKHLEAWEFLFQCELLQRRKN